METKLDFKKWSMDNANTVTTLVGIILILVAIIVGMEKTLSVILLSVGASILASSIVGFLNSRYLIQESKALQLAERWGIENIYTTRSQINNETNEMLKTVKKLDICAMGLKNYRDAKGKEIEQRVSEGMRLRILTINPNSSILAEIDRTEQNVEGSTRSDITSLLEWVESLKRLQLTTNQVQIRLYDHYPYEFYFCMDGVVFTGPYQNKSSQQTITYKFGKDTLGARSYQTYFNELWEIANE